MKPRDMDEIIWFSCPTMTEKRNQRHVCSHERENEQRQRTQAPELFHSINNGHRHNPVLT